MIVPVLYSTIIWFKSECADNSARINVLTNSICRGILEDLLLNGTGIDPTAFSIAPAIKNGKAPHPNVPTYIVHGSIDDKVPIVQAEDVVNAMKEKGLDVGKSLRPRHSLETRELC